MAIIVIMINLTNVINRVYDALIKETKDCGKGD